MTGCYIFGTTYMLHALCEMFFTFECRRGEHADGARKEVHAENIGTRGWHRRGVRDGNLTVKLFARGRWMRV